MVDVAICEDSINAHQVALMRPYTRVVAEIAEEEEDLEGSIQYKSGGTGQIQARNTTNADFGYSLLDLNSDVPMGQRMTLH
jgi:hypothetical protein